MSLKCLFSTILVCSFAVASHARGETFSFEPTVGTVTFSANCPIGCDDSGLYYSGNSDGVIYWAVQLTLKVEANHPAVPLNPPGPAHPIGSSWFLSGYDVNLTGAFDLGDGSPLIPFGWNSRLETQIFEVSTAVLGPGIYFPTVTASAFGVYRYRDGEGGFVQEQSPTYDFSWSYSPVNVAAVPTPIVGAGLPGFLMALAGFIGWRRSRRA